MPEEEMQEGEMIEESEVEEAPDTIELSEDDLAATLGFITMLSERSMAQTEDAADAEETEEEE